MRLNYLCDMHLTFDEDPILVRPYGGQEGVAYGLGSGTVTGEQLRGTARWVNHPHRRSDSTMLPDMRGIITTEDGATIMFTMRGRTTWVNTPQGPIGNQLLPIFFEAEDERYRWLNNAVCILEGTIKERPTTGPGRPQQVGSGRVYVCVNELVS